MLSRDKIEAMRNQLKSGVSVVSAPQLFPTPIDIAERMVDYAQIQPTDIILEPSAGTGRLVDAILDTGIHRRNVALVEINRELADNLASKYGSVYPGNFLDRCSWELGGPFDKVIMNPPFEKGADIKHIKHAKEMLKPDGVLVGICANGPRQNEQIKPQCEHWEILPRDTFQGTSVSSALFVIRN